jgi:hypothetical protein
MEVYIELFRPVNPVGKSFIRYTYGALAAKDKELINKYKREIMRNMQRLGFKLEEIVGRGKLISGTFVIVLDDNTREPKKIYAKEINVWGIEKILDQNIETEIS